MTSVIKYLFREAFSLTTIALVAIPLLMHNPASGQTILDTAEYNAKKAVAALPVQQVERFITTNTGAFSLARSGYGSKGGSVNLTVKGGPIFLPY